MNLKEKLDQLIIDTLIEDWGKDKPKTNILLNTKLFKNNIYLLRVAMKIKCTDVKSIYIYKGFRIITSSDLDDEEIFIF